VQGRAGDDTAGLLYSTVLCRMGCRDCGWGSEALWVEGNGRKLGLEEMDCYL
jgi:hypothetical protein